MNIKKFFLLVLFILCINFSLAEVVVFESYETTTTLDDGKLHIDRYIKLRNVGSNPIIPGELHFKLHEISKGKKIPSEIDNLVAINDYNQELKTRIVEGKVPPPKILGKNLAGSIVYALAALQSGINEKELFRKEKFETELASLKSVVEAAKGTLKGIELTGTKPIISLKLKKPKKINLYKYLSNLIKKIERDYKVLKTLEDVSAFDTIINKMSAEVGEAQKLINKPYNIKLLE